MSEQQPIGVIGVGWVGLVTATCFAELGHPVVALDVVEEKVEALRRGEATIHEPGIQEMLQRNAERLRFTTSMEEVLDRARLLFCCVDTPPTYSGDADLSRVRSVVAKLPADGDHALVMKSTVPSGTGAAIRRDRPGLPYVSCPEFLREGSALDDFLHPDRVVIGADAGSEWAADAVEELYRPLGGEIVRTDVASAEMIKLASNAFLATKISFINEIANVCEQTGADVLEVARGMGLDDRIGPSFLSAGIGYGGSCFAPDETLLVRLWGTPKLVTFEQLWELAGGDAAAIDGEAIEPEGVEAWSWVPGEAEPEWMPVAVLTRRDYDGEMVEVRTKMGRRLRVTADHPFLVGDGRQADVATRVLARDLTEDDWLPLAQGGVTAPEPAVAALDDASHRAEASTPSERELEPLPAAPARNAVSGGGADQPAIDSVWSQNSERKRSFLARFDGSHGPWRLVNDGGDVALEWSTPRHELADGVARMLAELGIVCAWRRGRTAKSTKETHWLRVSGADQVELALFLVPQDEQAAVLEAIARQAKRIRPTGYRRFGEGPAWLRVTQINRERQSGPVYSLKVPGSQTIVTTGGLTVLQCFPKDVSALKMLAGNSGYHFQLLNAVIEVNELQKRRVVAKLEKHLGSLVGREIALLGLAFKPNTDDMREASSLVLASRLQGEGANVRAYDPVATETARDLLPSVEMAESVEAALDGADAAVLVTEWGEFAEFDWASARERMTTPLVVDGRNYLDPAALRAAGFVYEGIGRANGGRA